jgi:hypothetical protein
MMDQKTFQYILKNQTLWADMYAKQRHERKKEINYHVNEHQKQMQLNKKLFNNNIKQEN